MAGLTELAASYRETAARLALRLRRMKAEGAEQYRVNHMAEVLRETRQTARTLSRYYDAPRDPDLTAAGYCARKGRNHDG